MSVVDNSLKLLLKDFIRVSHETVKFTYAEDIPSFVLNVHAIFCCAYVLICRGSFRMYVEETLRQSFFMEIGWLSLNLKQAWCRLNCYCLSYNIFQNQGIPLLSCLADATRRLVLPGVASACVALRCLARQDEPWPMLPVASDIWLPAQVVHPITALPIT